MMRRLIGKIISLIIQPPKTEKPQEAQDAPKEATAETPKKETKIITLDQLLGGSREAPPPEPNLRVIGLYSDVNDEKIAELTQAILYLNEVNRLSDEDKKKPIEFYINTYGGSADDMFALYDVMEVVKEETEIHTIGVGKVMSAGTLLLAAGTKGKRKVGRNCRIMIHNVSAGSFGNLPTLANELEAIHQLQEDYINAMVANTKFTRKKLERLLNEKVNIYLSAEEAVKYGLADEIM
jgi:ATP-dependent Clp protease protease subunit